MPRAEKRCLAVIDRFGAMFCERGYREKHVSKRICRGGRVTGETLERDTGLEPATFALARRRSTN
jgi:hypothetical protein